MRPKIIAILTLLIFVAIGTGIYVKSKDRKETSESLALTPKAALPNTRETPMAVHDADEEEQQTSKQHSVGEEAQQTPREIVNSIYDYDLDYRINAQAAAERKVAPFSPDSVLRWRPVRIKPASILTGNYLEEESMPKSFQVTPFPDITVTVIEIKYTIMDHIEQASWEGAIVGSDHGRVEISIVGGVDNPAFVIKIINETQIISISPTEMPGAYVAIEGNPHQPSRSSRRNEAAAPRTRKSRVASKRTVAADTSNT